MKTTLFTTFAVAALALSASPAFAATVTDGTTEFAEIGQTQETRNLTTTTLIESAFESFDSGDLEGFVLYYKAEVEGKDEGSFNTSYTTTFSPDEDPTHATITHQEDSASMTCPTCYLIVKDGAQGNPAQYLFDLRDWNGTDTLELLGFWEGEGVPGSISNVAIWGPEGGLPIGVAEPASLALLGLGLLGMAWVTRRRYGSGPLG